MKTKTHSGSEHEAATRRGLLLFGVASSASLVLGACASPGKPAHAPDAEHSEKGESGEEAEVTPAEDLMQEHGVLDRILLVYGEAAGRIERAEHVDLRVVNGAARIVRRFIEDYHERTEEQYVFPKLEAAQREVRLVGVLRRQHQRGRELTEQILRASSNEAESLSLPALLRSFERMYRPHAAREDTVLFPAFRSLMSKSAYRELGEQFEEQEHKKLGPHGFENAVKEVAALETALGLEDLSRFTP